MPYHHTQRAIVMIFIYLFFAAFAAVYVWRTGQPSMIGALTVFIVLAIVFSSLTVDIDGNELRWHFGLGFWTCRLPLDEIQSVAVVRIGWWSGSGIRIWPGYRLYRVAGLDAVELKLKSGAICRIGTDDPQGLAAALKASVRS